MRNSPLGFCAMADLFQGSVHPYCRDTRRLDLLDGGGSERLPD